MISKGGESLSYCWLLFCFEDKKVDGKGWTQNMSLLLGFILLLFSPSPCEVGQQDLS